MMPVDPPWRRGRMKWCRTSMEDGAWITFGSMFLLLWTFFIVFQSWAEDASVTGSFTCCTLTSALGHQVPWQTSNQTLGHSDWGGCSYIYLFFNCIISHNSCHFYHINNIIIRQRYLLVSLCKDQCLQSLWEGKDSTTCDVTEESDLWVTCLLLDQRKG